MAFREQTTALRNRIIGHRQIKASELKHHPLNWREHPKGQQQALQSILQEVGLARSLLCYVAQADQDRTVDNNGKPLGPLTLIDGHLRADMHPDQIVEVEILDVTDEEARKLLLTIDPLVSLGKPNYEMLRNLNTITKSENQYLNDLWQTIGKSQKKAREDVQGPARVFENQYLVLITCDHEQQQLDLLEEMKSRGLTVKAVIG